MNQPSTISTAQTKIGSRSAARTPHSAHKLHDLDESGLRKAIGRAAQQVGIAKPVGPHILRYSFATHPPEAGYDIRTIQELMRHKSAENTLHYTHLTNRGGMAVLSPVAPV